MRLQVARGRTCAETSFSSDPPIELIASTTWDEFMSPVRERRSDSRRTLGPMPNLRPELSSAVIAAVALGALSTAGDWIWARWIPDGAVLPGVVHGVVFFAALAFALGGAARSREAMRRLLWTLPVAGLLLAAAFYPLAYAVGYLGALLVTWTLMWLALALLQRWARGGEESARRAVTRGLIAAVGSGLAFWAVSGMWTRPAGETGYPLRLVYWTFAFLPGLLALFLGRRPARGESAPEVTVGAGRRSPGSR